MDRRQRQRLLLRTGFFALFLLAPPLDIFRFDLTLNHFVLFGQPWTLGLAAFQRGEIDAAQAAANIILRGFLPLALLAALIIGVAWRWGRLYCGWLCPHFSVVELLNAALSRACGKHSIWDRQRRPGFRSTPLWWLIWVVTALGMAFLWAASLLSYLLPPAEVWGNLLSLQSTPRQLAFIGVATLVFSVDFLFARHLFCRFGCALGVFQSLAWMANRKAQVVHFERRQASACLDCDNACDHACPMRLKPRSLKRRMFNCTQCLQCVSACAADCAPRGVAAPLHWTAGQPALDKSDRRAARAAPPPVRPTEQPIDISALRRRTQNGAVPRRR